jgi:sulfur relay protein TusB/DsrH
MSVLDSNQEATMAACLHVVMSASLDTMQACVQHAVAGDSILLIDTAVSRLLDQSWIRDLPTGINVLAAEADVRARGLTGLALPGQLLSDQGWAELVASHAHCLSWK